MPRIRSVHPDMCVSETMAEIGAELERSFVRLWTQCDDEGRAVDNPKLLKAALYPLHDDITAESLNDEIDQLAEAGLILRYEVDGRRYLCVTSWGEYQHPNRPQPSKLPAPPEVIHEPVTVSSVNSHEHSTPGVGGEKERERERAAAPRAPKLNDHDPDFDLWWDQYPRKAAKKDAVKAWPSAKASASTPELLAGLEAAKTAWAREQPSRPVDKMPYPATWLRGERWLDEPARSTDVNDGWAPPPRLV